jgi:hypothetical protein
MGKLIIIKRKTGTTQLVQHNNSDSRFSHMNEIADHLHAVTGPMSSVY